MPDFTIKIDCDNAAFEGSDIFSEVASILRDVARMLGDHHIEGGSLRDSNGNQVGRFYFNGLDDHFCPEDEDEDEDDTEEA